jgi:hypothetical protein
MKRWRKKGSHVGVVLSMLVFITFALFLYSVIVPAFKQKNSQKDLSIEFIASKLTGDLSSNLTVITITNNSASTSNYKCIQIDNSFLDAWDIKGSSTSTIFQIITKNESGDIINSSYNTNFNNIRIDWKNNEKFFKIYVANESFNQRLYGIEPAENEISRAFTTGLITTDKYVFDSKILALLDYYNNNYITLKNQYNLQQSTEFGFGFKYANQTIIQTSDKNISAEIYSQEIPVQYVDKEANINQGFLIVKVW